MSARKVHGPFHDEQGDVSAARILLALSLGYTFGFLAGVVLWNREVADGAWQLLTAINTALATWAGAPRVARYISRKSSPPSLPFTPPTGPEGE